MAQVGCPHWRYWMACHGVCRSHLNLHLLHVDPLAVRDVPHVSVILCRAFGSELKGRSAGVRTIPQHRPLRLTPPLPGRVYYRYAGYHPHPSHDAR